MASDERSVFIDAAAALTGLVIPSVCRPGVEANLAIFLHHACVVAAADDDPLREPTEVFQP